MICKKCGVTLPDQAAYCFMCGAAQSPLPRTGRKRGNGEGTVIKRGKTYTAIYTKYINGRRITKTKGGFIRRKDAIAYIPELKNTKSKGVITLDSLYQPWSTSAMLKLSTSKQVAYKIAWEKLAGIAYDNIAELTIGDLQSVIDAKAPTFYPARDMKSLLSHLYKRACAQGDVLTNLAQYIVLPELEEGEPTPFTKEELKALWKSYADGDRFVAYILLMIYSGMMPGELLKCEKSMIDWEKQTIIRSGLKTKKRKATPIVIADIIIPVLQDICNREEGKKLVSLKKNDFYDEFDATLRRCGCRDLTPYACRHTTGTEIALSGANIAPSVIQEVMRHSKFTTTQRYIHPDTVDALNAVNKIGK